MKNVHLSVLLVTTLFCSTVQAKEEILWVKWNLAPEYIESGEFSGQGYLDNFLRYVTSLLPDYEHREVFQTVNRLQASWTQGNVCTVHLWLGYWPDKIVYSKPYGFTPRFGIVTKANSKLVQLLGNRQSVSLEYLLSETNYRLGILPLRYNDAEGSRYPQLQSVISHYVSSRKVMEFGNSGNEISVDLLDYDRVDYIIRQRITHNSELTIRHLPNHYRFYYIEEGLTYKQVAAACSNSDLGHRVISQVNAKIGKEFYETYLRYRQMWDVDNTLFEQVYNDYFIKKKPNPYIVE